MGSLHFLCCDFGGGGLNKRWAASRSSKGSRALWCSREPRITSRSGARNLGKVRRCWPGFDGRIIVHHIPHVKVNVVKILHPWALRQCLRRGRVVDIGAKKEIVCRKVSNFAPIKISLVPRVIYRIATSRRAMGTKVLTIIFLDFDLSLHLGP